MSNNTAKTVREKLVATIQSIAVSDLGFDLPLGNVHSCLFDYVLEEKQTAYLMADVGGTKELRSWGVQVLERETPHGSNNLYRRTFDITVEGYGPKGEDEQTELIDRARLVRKAIRALGSCLGIGLLQIEDFASVDISERTGDVESGGGGFQAITWQFSALDDLVNGEE